MGLSDFFRRRSDREKAIPEPGSAEFQDVVQGSELPGSTGAAGVEGPWASVEKLPTQTIDMRGSGAREEIIALMRKHGIDPESGEQIDSSAVPGFQQEVLEVLKRRGLNPGG